MSNQFPATLLSPLNRRKHASGLIIFFIMTLFLSTNLQGTYIQRFSTIDNGGIAFTGNGVGLSKATGENNPGKNDSIGAFMTVNPQLQVNNYPAGTTLLIAENSSSAILDLPPSSDVLYAELIWSGSYGWPLNNPLPPPAANCQVTLTTPQKITHMIKADKTTAQYDLSPGFTSSGNYVRSANVTSLVQLGGKGEYTVSKIPGTVDPSDEEHNAAGWTLAVVYRNPKMYTNKMTLWVGCEQGKNSKSFHVVENFCTPSSGVKTARLFISAIEGDAIRAGDHVLFGSHPNLVFPKDALSGTNNPIDNFFASQINTLVEMSKDNDGKLIHQGHAQLDTRGTFGKRNQNAHDRQNVEGGRQGYDITSIDISSNIAHHQTSAYIQGQTLEGDEDYTIGALGLQIQADAPIMRITKYVDGKEILSSPNAGQTLTITLHIKNLGTLLAKKVLVNGLMQKGLSFVPGSFKIDGKSMPDRYVQQTPLGDIEVDEAVVLEYKVIVESSLLEGKPKIKSSKIDYLYEPKGQPNAIALTSTSNPVTFTQ